MQKNFIKILLVLLILIGSFGGYFIIKGKFLKPKPKIEKTVSTETTEETQPPETVEQKISRLEKTLEKKPKDLESRLELATCYSEKGEVGLALIEFRKIILLSPKSPEAQQAKAWIKAQAKKAQTAWSDRITKQQEEAYKVTQYTSLTVALSSITSKVEQTEMGKRPPLAGETSLQPLTQYQVMTAYVPTFTPVTVYTTTVKR